MITRPNARRSGAVLLAGAAALGLLAAGCGRKPADSSGSSANPAKAAESAAAAVSVQPAVRKDISQSLDVTGSLVALQDVVVGTKLAGKLASVYPHEGDSVKTGQVVAVMDVSDFQAQIQQAQANLQAAITKEQQSRVALAQARNQLRQAQTTVDYTDRTTKTGVSVAQSQLQTAIERLSVVKQGARTQERQQAQEQVIAAKANYDKAKSDLQRYQRLYREQAVSQSQLDAMQAAFDSAQASYNSAVQAQSLIREGARPEDIRQAELAVQSARDSVAKAEADRSNVKLRQDDVANARSGVASAIAGISAAQAGVDQARASLRLAQDALNNCYIKSPIDGYVAERRAEPGQQLGSGGAVMRIVNPGSVYLQANLSESQFAQVRLGQSATITVDALPGRHYRGTVTRILPVASTAARTFSVRIDFPAGKEARPQMFARGEILTDVHRGAVLVPKDAVLFDAGGASARVFIAGSGGKAEERKVQTGYANPQYVEILSGVEPGEKVIIAGQNSLSNGDRIRVQ